MQLVYLCCVTLRSNYLCGLCHYEKLVCGYLYVYDFTEKAHSMKDHWSFTSVIIVSCEGHVSTKCNEDVSESNYEKPLQNVLMCLVYFFIDQHSLNVIKRISRTV